MALVVPRRRRGIHLLQRASPWLLRAAVRVRGVRVGSRFCAEIATYNVILRYSKVITFPYIGPLGGGGGL